MADDDVRLVDVAGVDVMPCGEVEGAVGGDVAELEGERMTNGSMLVDEGREAHWTPRELAIIEQLACGKANKEIASALGCSKKTVEFHVTNALRKAGVGSRLELVCKLMRPSRGRD